MSGRKGDHFQLDWLELRRGADARARTDSTEALLRALASQGEAPAPPLRIVDLGSGSGSNARYLMPRLAAAGVYDQRWTLVDHDPGLLREAAASLAAEAERTSEALGQPLSIQAVPCTVNLAREMEAVPMDGAHLVTASALLDLVSQDWITDLGARLDRVGVETVLMTLSVNGETEWSPPDTPMDERAMDAFHRDMERDKGFGPSLGAAAGAAFRETMKGLGHAVQGFDSPWDLGKKDLALQSSYLSGIESALEGTHFDRGELSAWSAGRRRAIEAKESRVVVGHLDVLSQRPSAGPKIEIE